LKMLREKSSLALDDIRNNPTKKDINTRKSDLSLICTSIEDFIKRQQEARASSCCQRFLIWMGCPKKKTPISIEKVSLHKKSN
ncbi:MAG TPA: hypothetical protein VLH77_03510, partial [Gammaproteobacteria bacterium]|nr:hypothetical protein [Gammaproteobacteria bacterium]